MKIITIHNLESGNHLLNETLGPIIIQNAPHSVRYLGIFAIEHIFNVFRRKFSNIQDVIFDIDDDLPSLFTLIDLGYKNNNILYKGDSKSVIKILHNLGRDSRMYK